MWPELRLRTFVYFALGTWNSIFRRSSFLAPKAQRKNTSKWSFPTISKTSTMKFNSAAALLAVGSLATTYGFTPSSSVSSFTSHRQSLVRPSARLPTHIQHTSRSATTLSMSTFKVGIVGATGAVGKEIVGCLEKRDFPVDSLRIFGSERSAGKEVDK